MNLPNKLSLLRILLTFVAMACLFTPGWPAKVAALGCFSVASLTDWLDGVLARRWGQRTPLGALLDPIADKVLVLGFFLAFVQLRVIPAWMVLLIVLRELLITGVRLIAASRQLVLSAAKEGKHKMVSQVITIFVILLVMVARAWSAPEGLPSAVDQALDRLILGCLWVTVVLTLVSGATFFWRHRFVLRDAVGR